MLEQLVMTDEPMMSSCTFEDWWGMKRGAVESEAIIVNGYTHV